MKISTKTQAILISLASLPVFSTAAFATDSPSKTATTAPAKPAQQSAPAKPAEPKSTITFKNDVDKISYIIGHQIAKSLKGDDINVNESELIKALKDGLSGKQSEIPQQESQAFLQKYLMDQQKARGDKNEKEGQAYLAKNKHQKGVITLPSGLQYKVLTAGTGAKPKSTDTVTVNYEGTLINGTVFDSSYQRGQPVSFPVSGVIKGWTEALQLMPTGSTWMLYVPSNLAYGERAPSGTIGPNSTLVFKVNLVSVAKPKEAAAPAPAVKKPVDVKK